MEGGGGGGSPPLGICIDTFFVGVFNEVGRGGKGGSSPSIFPIIASINYFLRVSCFF